MSITLGMASWQKGAGDWLTTFNADQQRLASAIDTLSAGGVAADSIPESALIISNAPVAGYQLEAANTSGGMAWSSTNVVFSELPGQSSFTQSEIVRVKADLSALEPVPDAGIDFDKIDYTGTKPTAGNYKLIIHNETKPELVQSIPVGNLGISGTPETGWVVKAQVVNGVVAYLYYSVTANSSDSNMIRYTSTDMPQYGDAFLATYAQNDLYESGRVARTAGQALKYFDTAFDEYYTKGQVSNTGGSLSYLDVAFTAAPAFGKLLNSVGATDAAFFPDYALIHFKESGGLCAFADDVAVSVGRRTDVSYPIDKSLDGCFLYKVKAINFLKGVTGSTSIQILRRRSTELMGDSTTRFDITSPGTPSASTRRYTYDGTGTDPVIADSDASLRVGDWVQLYGQNFSAVNKGTFKITAVGSNYFEILNVSGSAENDKTIGTGYIIPVKKMLSTELTISDAFESENGVMYSASNRSVLASGDILIPDITATHTTVPLGLLLSYRFGGLNVSP